MEETNSSSEVAAISEAPDGRKKDFVYTGEWLVDQLLRHGSEKILFYKVKFKAKYIRKVMYT